MRVEGVVTSTKPLFQSGAVITGLKVQFEGGMAVAPRRVSTDGPVAADPYGWCVVGIGDQFTN